MSDWISLRADDGHRLDAWRAMPEGAPRGALVVVQEIFGVNRHVRSVADGYAAEGYAVVAPALFDRIAPGIELGYGEADVRRGRELRVTCGLDKPMHDLDAALRRVRADAVAAAGPGAPALRAGIVGYCWGGLLAWLAAGRLEGLAAAVPYYGGGIPDHATVVPRCPVLAHFGDRDALIPLPTVESFRAAQPGVEVMVHAADHGFNCDQRGSYDAVAAAAARTATLAFLRRHVG